MGIISAAALMPIKIKAARSRKTIRYLPSFPFILRLVTLSEKRFIRLTISKESVSVSRIRNTGEPVNDEIKDDPV